jgi:hypothetical protein
MAEEVLRIIDDTRSSRDRCPTRRPARLRDTVLVFLRSGALQGDREQLMLPTIFVNRDDYSGVGGITHG